MKQQRILVQILDAADHLMVWEMAFKGPGAEAAASAEVESLLQGEFYGVEIRVVKL